jgi:hypothetical protein
VRKQKRDIKGGDTMKIEKILELLEDAYKRSDIVEINKLNVLVYEGLDSVVSESSLDFELLESIKNKTIYKTLCKSIHEGVSKHNLLKMLSSLVTHMIIESECRNKNITNYPIEIFQGMISKLLKDEVTIDETRKFLQDKYGRFL